MAKNQKQQKKRRTLSINVETYDRLNKYGEYKDSIADIINRCITSHEKMIGTA